MCSYFEKRTVNAKRRSKKTNLLIRKLETLRHWRKSINKEITLIVEREGFILQRLSDLRNLGISHVEPEPPASNDQLSTSSEGTQETSHLSANRGIVRQHSIAAVRRELTDLSNRSLTHFVRQDRMSQIQVGDRVRIANRLSHISGEPSEEDRLATVIKVNRIRVQVETDDGHKTSRIRGNL